jgi:MFS family permease
VLLTTRTSPVEAALAWASATASLAKGLQFAISALFFTTVIGLSPATVGVGLTIAGGAGMAAAFGSGYLADRVGARRVLLGAALGQGAALGAYCVVRSAVPFVLVACVALAAQGAQRTAQSALLARQFTGAARVQVRARLRVVTNVSVGLGSDLAAGALAVGSATAYRLTMIVAALLVLSSLAALRRVPETPRHFSVRVPFRDRRYLLAAALNGVMTIQFGLLTVGVPLWVTAHTRAPAVTVALLLVLNTVVVALFQVRAARLARDVPAAGRVVLAAAVALVVACGLYATASRAAAAVAVGLLILAVLAHSLGEILSEAGGWELAFELADPRAAGIYQGISQTGFAVGTALAPAVVTATAVDHGAPGWAALSAMFLAAGVGTLVLAARHDS